MQISGKRKITMILDPHDAWAIVRALNLLADHDEKNMPEATKQYEELAEEIEAYMKTR